VLLYSFVQKVFAKRESLDSNGSACQTVRKDVSKFLLLFPTFPVRYGESSIERMCEQYCRVS